MTVKELKEILDLYDGNELVVMFSDSEGNSCSPLSSVYREKYIADNDWSGNSITEEQEKEMLKEEDPALKKAVDCCLLIPVN